MTGLNKSKYVKPWRHNDLKTMYAIHQSNKKHRHNKSLRTGNFLKIGICENV